MKGTIMNSQTRVIDGERKMKKLILTYNIGQGEPCGSYLVVMPLEYESLEQWVIDFGMAYTLMLEHTLANTYPAPVINIPGSTTNLMGRFLQIYDYEKLCRYYTLEEFMEVNDIQIAELDVWFEHNKGKSIT
jgi:hypothetical protein